jgi:hypothetical protein
LEKNLAQQKIDGRTLKYKLEIYQRNFLNFVCGSPTSTEALGWDEGTEAGPSGTVPEEEV